MATVRLSQQLHRQLLDAAKEKYKVTNPEPNQSPELISALRTGLQTMPAVTAFNTMLATPAIQNEMATAKSELSHALNRADPSNVTEIRVNNITKHTRYAETGDPTDIYCELDTPVQLPFGSNYGAYDVSINSFDITIRDELHSTLAIAIDNTAAYQEKFSHFAKSINSVLEQCNTVKQLLEVWPGAEALLPNDVIQKLHTKVTRKVDAEKVRDLSQFDADAANQVLLTSSLLGD